MRSETNMFSHPTLEPTYSQEGQPALRVLKEWGIPTSIALRVSVICYHKQL